ncbi:MAG: succinylglutamate desuccinylase [Deltaproteobacteria bacterium]|jgi:predicted deacylase|nr:succinylglutamate desuccinylase [Deltaproteobacteria bacterium]
MNANRKTSAYLILAACLVLTVILCVSYIPMWKYDLIVPGPGVTKVAWLSDYVPELKGSLADTRVFILEGQEPGANILVLSGHHADEPGGWMSGMVLVENAKVRTGKLVVIPQANNSGFTHNYPQEAHAQFINIPLSDGSKRRYRHGSRTGNSAEHWPDPEVFIQYPSGQKLSGDEVRNLNRAYPGRLNGTFTERIAYGIQMVVRKEGIDLQMDMPEAQPEYPFVNAASAHPAAEELVSLASLGMQTHDLDLGVELSPATFRGLSNREMGDAVPGLFAVTMETPNTEQGKIRGITDDLLAVEGQDAFYVAAAKLGNLFVPYDEGGWPLKRRVGRHLTSFMELALALQDVTGKPFEISNVPDYYDLVANDVGHYLNPVTDNEKVSDPGYQSYPGIWRLFSKAGS